MKFEIGNLIELTWGLQKSHGILVNVDRDPRPLLPSFRKFTPSLVVDLLERDGVVYTYDVWDEDKIEVIA
jgi:hypothetical protein